MGLVNLFWLGQNYGPTWKRPLLSFTYIEKCKIGWGDGVNMVVDAQLIDNLERAKVNVNNSFNINRDVGTPPAESHRNYINNVVDIGTSICNWLVRLSDVKARAQSIWNFGINVGMFAKGNEEIVVHKIKDMEYKDKCEAHNVARATEEEIREVI